MSVLHFHCETLNSSDYIVFYGFHKHSVLPTIFVLMIVVLFIMSCLVPVLCLYIKDQILYNCDTL